MIKKEEIRDYLGQMTRKLPPSVVIGRLEKGSIVPKSFGLSYEIDDVDIDKRLGTWPNGVVPCGPIYRKLRTFPEKILELFSDKKILPFSKVFEAGVGECLEKAILVQLAAQRDGDSFLVLGALEENRRIGAETHAFNVLFRQGEPFLVDTQNPLEVYLDSIIKPYTAPILGISKNTQFRVPKEWRLGRTYSIT